MEDDTKEGEGEAVSVLSTAAPPQHRHIFISASSLGRQFKEVPEEVLENALFFFGSKVERELPLTRPTLIHS